MSENESPGVGELSRQVRDVLVRFEGLATRLETQFVRSDNFNLYKQLVDQSIKQLQDVVVQLARAEKVEDLEESMKYKADTAAVNTLSKRVDDLEDGKKWITRLVLGFIILGVLGAVLVFQGTGAPK